MKAVATIANFQMQKKKRPNFFYVTAGAEPGAANTVMASAKAVPGEGTAFPVAAGATPASVNDKTGVVAEGGKNGKDAMAEVVPGAPADEGLNSDAVSPGCSDDSGAASGGDGGFSAFRSVSGASGIALTIEGSATSGLAAAVACGVSSSADGGIESGGVLFQKSSKQRVEMGTGSDAGGTSPRRATDTDGAASSVADAKSTPSFTALLLRNVTAKAKVLPPLQTAMPPHLPELNSALTGPPLIAKAVLPTVTGGRQSFRDGRGGSHRSSGGGGGVPDAADAAVMGAETAPGLSALPALKARKTALPALGITGGGVSLAGANTPHNPLAQSVLPSLQVVEGSAKDGAAGGGAADASGLVEGSAAAGESLPGALAEANSEAVGVARPSRASATLPGILHSTSMNAREGQQVKYGDSEKDSLNSMLEVGWTIAGTRGTRRVAAVLACLHFVS